MEQKKKVRLEPLTDIGMLLMVKKNVIEVAYIIFSSICNDNNQYTKNYNENRKSSYLMYWNLYRLEMSLRIEKNYDLMKILQRTTTKRVIEDNF